MDRWRVETSSALFNLSVHGYGIEETPPVTERRVRAGISFRPPRPLVNAPVEQILQFTSCLI